jgi:transcriptional regulator with XRE-family HTH domain
MKPSFSSQLYRLRTNGQLTNAELAQLADVPESLISGLQNDNRRVGELQARKIGGALNLHGEQLEEFVLDAIDTCTQKILEEAKPYPAQLLNLLANQLSDAGIGPESLSAFTITGDALEQDIQIALNNGRRATLKTQLVLN